MKIKSLCALLLCLAVSAGTTSCENTDSSAADTAASSVSQSEPTDVSDTGRAEDASSASVTEDTSSVVTTVSKTETVTTASSSVTTETFKTDSTAVQTTASQTTSSSAKKETTAKAATTARTSKTTPPVKTTASTTAVAVKKTETAGPAFSEGTYKGVFGKYIEAMNADVRYEVTVKFEGGSYDYTVEITLSGGMDHHAAENYNGTYTVSGEVLTMTGKLKSGKVKKDGIELTGMLSSFASEDETLTVRK